MFDSDAILEKGKKITELRDELYDLLEEYGLNHSKVLESSRELDALVLEFLYA